MSATAPTVRPLTVLVVDDDPDAASRTCALLARSGHRVLRATGERALALAATDPPDAVVLELMMPWVNGAELARQLRDAGSGDRRVVLVALTGWRGTEVRRWAA